MTVEFFFLHQRAPLPVLELERDEEGKWMMSWQKNYTFSSVRLSSGVTAALAFDTINEIISAEIVKYIYFLLIWKKKSIINGHEKLSAERVADLFSSHRNNCVNSSWVWVGREERMMKVQWMYHTVFSRHTYVKCQVSTLQLSLGRSMENRSLTRISNSKRDSERLEHNWENHKFHAFHPLKSNWFHSMYAWNRSKPKRGVQHAITESFYVYSYATTQFAFFFDLEDGKWAFSISQGFERSVEFCHLHRVHSWDDQLV